MKRWRFRYTLSTLLVVTAIIAIAVAIGNGFVRTRQKQQLAVEKMRDARMSVKLKPARAHWLGRFVGYDLMNDIEAIECPTISYSSTPDFGVYMVPGLVRIRINFSDDEWNLLTACPNIRTLNLDETNLNDAALAIIADMTDLTELRIGGTLASAQGIKCISRLHLLERLSLSGMTISENLATVLGGLGNLVDLDLSFTDLSDENCKALRECPSLERLNLNGTIISNQGLALLAAAKNLRTLSIAKTQISAEGLLACSKFPLLEEIHVSGGLLTPQAITALASVKSLRRLIVESDPIAKVPLAAAQNRLPGVTIDNTYDVGCELQVLSWLRAQPKDENRTPRRQPTPDQTN